MGFNLTLLIQIFEIALVLLLSVGIVIVIPKVKEIANNKIKTGLYIMLGLILFMLVGLGYNVMQDMHVDELIANKVAAGESYNPEIIGKDAESILWPYKQFYPLLIFSIALAGVSLVAFIDGEIYGYIFAGTGFGMVIPDLLKYMGNGRYDLLLLAILLWSIIPVLWVFFFRGLANEEAPSLRERSWAAIKASLFSFPVYAATAAVALYGESPRSLSSGMLQSIVNISDQIGMFILIALWFYLLLTAIIVSMMYVIHDLTLHTFNIKRTVVAGKGVKYVVVHPIVEAIKVEEPKIDAYKNLIDEIGVFAKYIDQVDRLRAASTIARFKNEYNTLAQRYDSGSKAEADRLIRQVDQDFKKRY